MRDSRMLFVSCLFGLLCGLCSTAQANPQVGWYWNPAESGRGFFIESLDTLIYMGGYLYDSDGHALWVVAGGSNSDPYNYSGRLLTLSGGQTLTDSYHAPTALQDAGPVSIHFSDDTHATLTWPGGTIQLQRDIFGTGASGFKPLTGWWWNPNESGRGYSIEVQGNNLFFVGFMYEANGRPVWYFSAGPVGADPSTYSGPLLQLANGQTMTGPYQPPSAQSTIGTLDIVFTGENAGTLTFTRTSAAKAARTAKDDVQVTADDVPVTVPIVPEFAKPGDYVTPDWFIGSFQEEVNVTLGIAGVTGTGDFFLKGNNVTWQKQSIDGSTGVTTYVMLGGDITLISQTVLKYPDPELGLTTCYQDATGAVKLRFPFTAPATLTIDSFGRYDLNLNFDGLITTTLDPVVCKGPFGGVIDGFPTIPFPNFPLAMPGLFGAVTFDDLAPLGGSRLGVIEKDAPLVQGSLPPVLEYTQTGHYKFEESPECATEFCPTPP